MYKQVGVTHISIKKRLNPTHPSYGPNTYEVSRSEWDKHKLELVLT